MNMLNVQQADLALSLLQLPGFAGTLQPVPPASAGADASECLRAWRACCMLVRRALQGDLLNAFKHGKPLIVEGSCLDVGLFFAEAGIGIHDAQHSGQHAGQQCLGSLGNGQRQVALQGRSEQLDSELQLMLSTSDESRATAARTERSNETSDMPFSDTELLRHRGAYASAVAPSNIGMAMPSALLAAAVPGSREAELSADERVT